MSRGSGCRVVDLGARLAPEFVGRRHSRRRGRSRPAGGAPIGRTSSGSSVRRPRSRSPWPGRTADRSRSGRRIAAAAGDEQDRPVRQLVQDEQVAVAPLEGTGRGECARGRIEQIARARLAPADEHPAVPECDRRLLVDAAGSSSVPSSPSTCRSSGRRSRPTCLSSAKPPVDEDPPVGQPGDAQRSGANHRHAPGR